MTTFPRSPRIIKGALVGLDPLKPLASVIVFQYNPDTLTRRIAANTPAQAQTRATRGQAVRLNGPPRETIGLEVEIDAADQLERADPLAAATGIHPALASLEMLLYPSSALMIANEVLARSGIIEVVPAEAPLTLFVWGIKRVVPVRLSEFTITEEAFDPDLNPIRAKVSLSLQVLTYQDLGLTTPGGALSMANQVVKEVMATLGGVNAIAGAAGSVSLRI